MEADRLYLVAPFFREIPEPESAGAQALYAYWRDKHSASGNLPSRDKIEFDELVSLGLADRVFILEPIDGGADWRYRLLGSEIVRMYGGEVTNVPFREHMSPQEAKQAIELSNRTAFDRRPLFLKARFTSGDYTGVIETMSLPILNRSGSEVWLFGGTFFLEGALAFEP